MEKEAENNIDKLIMEESSTMSGTLAPVEEEKKE